MGIEEAFVKIFMGVEVRKSQHMGTWCESNTLGFNRQEEHSEAKYDCMAGYSNWRSGWSLDKKSWPGSLARVGKGPCRLWPFLRPGFFFNFPRKTRTGNLYIEDIDVSFVGVLTQIQVGWGMARWHDESKNKIRLHGQKLVLFNLFGMRNNHLPSGKLT